MTWYKILGAICGFIGTAHVIATILTATIYPEAGLTPWLGPVLLVLAWYWWTTEPTEREA